MIAITLAKPARLVGGNIRAKPVFRLPVVVAPSRSHAFSTQTQRRQSTATHSQSLPHSSVHQSEIDHFTRLSSQWWDPHGELGLLHKMNKGRVQFLKQKVLDVEGWERAQQGVRCDSVEEERWNRDWLSGKQVLDVGCGGGLLSESLARLGADVHGIDATKTNIAIAESHAARDPFFTSPGASLRYSHTTAEDLLEADPGQQFDVVASVEVLEHVSSPAEFLRSLDRLLKPGGHLLLSTINRNALSWFLTIGVAEKLVRLVSPGTHSWDKFIKPEELKDFVCNKDGLGWYPADTFTSPSSPASLHDSASLPVPRRLQIESRGIAYDPLLSDWRLLERSSWLQSSGLGEGCNYLLWARKPLA